MKYKHLIVIGTSHIAQQSLTEVKNVITQEDPDIIALELDKARLHSLLFKQDRHIQLRDIFKIGLKGYLFALFGAWAERKLGKMVGVSPGSEMILAARLARRNKKKIALIDQEIGITLKKLSRQITWKEKWHFLVDLCKGVVLKKKEIDFDLTTVPSRKTIAKLISKVKKRYPSVYYVLIKERNYYMARKLHQIMEKNTDKKIVAFVGAGHEEDIISIIKKIEKGLVTYV